MHILQAQPFDLEFLSADLKPLGEDRTVGLHVSDILRDIDNKLLNKGKRKPFDELADYEIRRMGFYTEMGWMWESMVSSHFRFRMLTRGEKFSWVTQQEVELDDIYLTLDAFDLQSLEVLEFKATWRSMDRMEKPERNFWYWLSQIKAYCKAMGVTQARLYVFWVCGDYRNSGPCVMEYQLQFSQEEIDGNWNMIVAHAETMRKGD